MVLVFFGLAFLVKIIIGVRAKQRCVWGRALELALQVGPQLRKLIVGVKTGGSRVVGPELCV